MYGDAMPTAGSLIRPIKHKEVRHPLLHTAILCAPRLWQSRSSYCTLTLLPRCPQLLLRLMMARSGCCNPALPTPCTPPNNLTLLLYIIPPF